MKGSHVMHLKAKPWVSEKQKRQRFGKHEFLASLWLYPAGDLFSSHSELHFLHLLFLITVYKAEWSAPSLLLWPCLPSHTLIMLVCFLLPKHPNSCWLQGLCTSCFLCPLNPLSPLIFQLLLLLSFKPQPECHLLSEPFLILLNVISYPIYYFHSA